MSAVDRSISEFVNQFSRQSPFFDKAMVLLSSNHLTKSALIASALWYFWFRADSEASQRRRTIFATLLVSVIAMFLARLMALTLPFSFRPIHDSDVRFVLPAGLEPEALHGWSSFPSDHAVLYFSLCTGVYLISRRWGIWLGIYTALFVAFPRLYLGLHFATDLVVGMVFGVVCTRILVPRWSNSTRTASVVDRADRHPEFFYPVFALVLFQISEMFESVRMILGAAFARLLH